MTITNSTTTHPSLFSALEPVAKGGPFALEAQFRADQHANKVNLIIGAYRDDQARPWQLASVAEAKKRIHVETCLHEYLPLRGNSEFLEAAKLLVFGEQADQPNDSIASIQTISGTGANSLIARFLQKHGHSANIWLPDPTWVNHKDIWNENAHSIKLRWYPYYNETTRTIDFESMMKTLSDQAHENDAILLHACAHNPTGVDPTRDQWEEIAQLCRTKKMFVIFDLAYQGFASGDLDNDAWAIRHFLTYPEQELAVCQSFSKNLGLYGERVGVLHVVMSRSSPSTAAHVEDHLVELQRAFVSMAPLFGCRVANEIFKSKDLRTVWQSDLVTMSGRIKAMRKALYKELVRLGTPGRWEHIIQQTGMFSYLGLSKKQVDQLREEYHVYMLTSGRASICGLTSTNVKYTAGAIHSVITSREER
ncbi:aspartate aminotransferase [Fusarium albosuccineum]|uniref:Aspartate aminotransferase n=1 Tax=Fusarium albosuccineum TaxID=1237068 RepID=A0A8H4LGV4_9HYPO|nr:aspartate aminotransferase [Fusarium albosuccineum]